jgi:UDP-galactopyranose mutase
LQSQEKTIIAKELSRVSEREDDPFYPVRTRADLEVLDLYVAEVRKMKNFFVGGRLGNYQYIDMHMAINQALVLFNRLKNMRLI